jgi:alkanesulfonate monooxygenase SsuD/methylene tetrahydromethanopterin reductase-like flavin-dependent oxidoreductase (luciferase family)
VFVSSSQWPGRWRFVDGALLAALVGAPVSPPVASAPNDRGLPAMAMNFELRHPAQFAATGAEIYRAALDMCRWADDRGFDRIGLGEHHQSPDGYIPAPLVFAGAVGACTTRIRVRCSILLAVLYDPVRLAEEIAVADLCLGGRLDVGLGVGYVEADFDAFGKNFHTRGAALDELIPFLRRAWTGEPFEHRGTTVRVTPRPVQDPMPIHVGGASPAGVRRAVELADGYFPPGMPAGWNRYRRLAVAAGRPDPGEYPASGPVFLWVTDGPKEDTWERLAPHIRHQVRSYAAWTEGAYGEPQGPFVPERDIEDLRQGGAYEVLDPDEAVALLRRLGPGGRLSLNPLLSGIDPAAAWAMLDLFDREVLGRM